MKFEAWHQNAKNHARKGMGKKITNVHAFHGELTEKACLRMDVELHTLGRIPPTRRMREAFQLVFPSIFHSRYHERLLTPTHGSRPEAEVPQKSADVWKTT